MLGYCADLADAKKYFTDERLETSAWDDLSTDPMMTKAVNMAYNRLYYSEKFNLPENTSATATQLVKLRKANCEMAYYMALHLTDEDKRKGIQAQGTIKAGIVKEEYSESDLHTLPFPPFVIELLKGYLTDKHIYIIEIDRDEDLGADEDATIL